MDAGRHVKPLIQKTSPRNDMLVVRITIVPNTIVCQEKFVSHQPDIEQQSLNPKV